MPVSVAKRKMGLAVHDYRARQHTVGCGTFRQKKDNAMAQSDSNPGDAKSVLRALIAQHAVQLSPDQISARNLPAAAPALRRSRDLTIQDHDPYPPAGDPPITIRV